MLDFMQVCPECQAKLVRSSPAFVVCPNGHGRLILCPDDSGKSSRLTPARLAEYGEAVKKCRDDG